MKPDFDRWLDYHSNAYPGFARWVGENKAQIEHMRRLLGHFGIEQLQQATDSLYAMDEQPNGYSNHARAIRRLCSPHTHSTTSAVEGPSVIDGRLVASCARCMDYGVVEVLSPKCLKALWADQYSDPQPVLTTCMIACDCQLGHEHGPAREAAAVGRRPCADPLRDGAGPSDHRAERSRQHLSRAVGSGSATA